MARNDEFWKKVGENVRALRNAVGMPQWILAADSGMSRSNLAMLEGGRSAVALDKLLLIAEALGVTVNDLIVGCVAPTPTHPEDWQAKFKERIRSLEKENFRLRKKLARIHRTVMGLGIFEDFEDRFPKSDPPAGG